MDIWERLYEAAAKEYHPEEVSPFVYAHHVVCALEADNGEIADALRRDGDLRARVAVEHGVAQKVIKDALQFVRVAPNGERIGCGERAGEVFFS